MNRIWHYLNNQFLNETERNFLKALILVEFTDAALTERLADAFFAAQYAILHPLYDTYNTVYDNWKTQQGTQKGKTFTKKQILSDLANKKINQWDAASQAAGVIKGSDNYIALFPRGHELFQTGKGISRINAINSLSSAIALQIPPLAPPTNPLVLLKTDLDTFYTLANDIFNKQKGEISDTEGDSDLVELARINAMVGLYAFLGACMNKYAANPVLIEPLFDLKTLRQHRQMLFKGHAVINKPHTVAERTVEADAQIKIKNTGVTDLQVYWAATSDAHPVPPTHPIVVTAGTEVTLPASSFGDVINNHFLMVLNSDLINKGEWEVEFL